MGIIKQPPTVFLTGNEAKIILQENATSGEVSTKAVNRLSFANPFVFNYAYNENSPAFYLKWGNVKIPFYFSHSASNSVAHVLKYLSDFSNDLGLYTEYVYSKLLKHPQIRSHFSLKNEGTFITLKAFRFGPEWNITYVTNTGDGSAIGFIENYIPGVLQTEYNNRTVRAFITTPDSVGISETNFFNDPDNPNKLIAEIDIAAYSKGDTFNHLSYPEVSTAIVDQSSALTEVNVAMNITKNGIDENSGYVSGPYYALNGKLSDMRMAMLLAEGKTLTDFLGSGNYRRFLTNCPNPKTTDIYAPEKLYLILPSGTYKTNVKKHFKCIEKTSVSDPFTVTSIGLFEFQVSYKKITEAEMYKIYAYEFWLTDTNGNKASEIFRFEVDRSYQMYARYFFFTNYYGVFDCIRTTGKVSKEKKLTKTLIALDEKAIASNSANYIQTDAQTNVKYKIETGLNSIAHNEWLQEFAESSKVLFIKNNKTFPALITEASLKSDDGEFLESNIITLNHLSYDDFSADFSDNSPILPDHNNDYNKDFSSFSFQDSGDYLPIANAGSDRYSLGTYVTLGAIAPPAGMTGKWTKISGAGSVTFDNDALPNAKATFSKTGSYALRWTVTYGNCTDFDEMVCVLTDAEIPEEPIIELPTVETLAISNLNGITATLNGNVVTDGGAAVIARGFAYGLLYTTPTEFVNEGYGLGEFSKDITLPTRDIYFVRAWAENSKGRVYGDPKVCDTRYSTYFDAVNNRIYKTMEIFIFGQRIEFFAENFDGTKYADGSDIPIITDTQQWVEQTNGAMCYFNNDNSDSQELGALYNWHTLDKICPAGGWRIPTLDDLNSLITATGVDRYHSGPYLKEKDSIYWSQNNGTDNLLFSARGSGFRSTSAINNGGNGFVERNNIFNAWANIDTPRSSMQLFAQSAYLTLSTVTKRSDGSNESNRLTDGLSIRFVRFS